MNSAKRLSVASKRLAGVLNLSVNNNRKNAWLQKTVKESYISEICNFRRHKQFTGRSSIVDKPTFKNLFCRPREKRLFKIETNDCKIFIF